MNDQMLIKNFAFIIHNDYFFPGIFLCCFGIIWFYVSLVFIFTNIILPIKYIRTTATVSKYYKKKSGGSHSTTLYKYIATYIIADEVYEIYSYMSASSKSLLPQIGEQVKIKFNPNNPKIAVFDSSGYNVIFIGLLLLALLLLYIGYCLITQNIPEFLQKIIEIF